MVVVVVVVGAVVVLVVVVVVVVVVEQSTSHSMALKSSDIRPSSVIHQAITSRTIFLNLNRLIRRVQNDCPGRATKASKSSGLCGNGII